MPDILTDFINQTLDLIFPRICINCENNLQNTESIFCNRCIIQTDVIPHTCCKICGYPSRTSDSICKECLLNPKPYIKAVSVFSYEGALGESIKKGKYHGNPWILKKLANQYMRPFLQVFSPDYLVPVPSSPSQIRKRGFGHTLLMAKTLAKNTDIKLFTKIEKKEMPPQAGLNFKSRRLLSKDAFIIKSRPPEGKLLIIDDVFTTGSTVKALSDALKTNGAEQIYVLTLARVLQI